VAQSTHNDPRGLFIRELRSDILPSFWCPHVESGLLETARKTNDYDDILQFYAGQVNAAGESLLYPRAHQTQSSQLDSCYLETEPHLLIQAWKGLISDIGHVAADINSSLKTVVRQRDLLSRINRRRLACQLVFAMRLMLLARLYCERADSNIVAKRIMTEAMPAESLPLPRGRMMQKKLISAVKQYDRQLREWWVGFALPVGWKDGGDAYAYDLWSQTFSEEVPGEEGWSSFPRLFNRELRYLRSRSSLRQRFHEAPLVFLSVLKDKWWRRILFFLPRVLLSVVLFLWNAVIITLLWFFKLTCGFGFRPRRIAGTVASVIPLFTGIYFADDTLIDRCSSPSGQQIASSLYNAITNLISLGGAPALCGAHIGIIASVETLIGYFVLSILAAMLFIWLTDR